ncbi:MAG: hypothetical protein P8X90_34545, partial [Desulfobacterales bacterium]
IHGWAADALGNVILPGPPRDSWGAKASRNGIIVCVEQIVSEDFIRRHSLLVKVPGSLVKAVCLTPYGSHPQNMSAQSLPEFEGYGLDYAFLKALRKATEDSQVYSQFVTEWVLNCGSHEDYLAKLGPKRLQSLKRSNNPLVSETEKRQPAGPNPAEKATPAERAIINGARIIKDIIVKNRYKSMFAGIGISGLAGWCAYYFLKEAGYHVDLIAAGIGYEPCPGDPLLISAANMATAKMISDSLDLHGVGAGGVNSRCLGVLGAGQIDKYGNLNSTIIRSRKGDDIYLAGAGGGNDIASLAREVVVVAVHRANRMIENVRYITCPGARVSTLATDEGLYIKDGAAFIMKGYFPEHENAEQNESVFEIARKCDWQIGIAPHLDKLTPPTAGELKLLRSFDPENVFLK